MHIKHYHKQTHGNKYFLHIPKNTQPDTQKKKYIQKKKTYNHSYTHEEKYIHTKHTHTHTHTNTYTHAHLNTHTNKTYLHTNKQN